MRTVEEIQSDISRVQQNQKQASAFISKYTEALGKAQSLEAEIDAVLPLVEQARNALNDVNTSVKEKGKQLVGESGFIKCVQGVIESSLHSIAATRYENIEYYYGQLKQMKSEINTTEIQGYINKYNGYFAQYQIDLENYQRELQEAMASGGA